MNNKLELKYENSGKIYLVTTPEETVRQKFLLELLNDYNYDLDQIAKEESVVGRGLAQARADYITISNKDYQQGENYARREGAEIFITHNSKETKIFQILREKRPLREIEMERK